MPNLVKKLPQIGSDKSFEALLRSYFEEEVLGSRSPLTVAAKKQDLKKFLLHFEATNGALLPVDQWLPIDTRRFLDELVRQQYKPATINRVLATLRAFAVWLTENGVVAINPCKGIRDLQLEPLAPKAIRDLDYFRITKTAATLALQPRKKYTQHHRNEALIAALSASGLRIHELLGLRVDQFQGKKFVDVRCKGGKYRTILIAKDAADLIHSYVAEHRVEGSPFLFTNRYGGQLSRNGVAEALNRVAAHCNVNLAAGEAIELRPHLLRHRHAYKARSAHGDVFAAKRLGHSSLKHLERYAGLTESEESDLLERM